MYESAIRQIIFQVTMTEDLMKFPETAREAKLLGLKYYFTEEPCKNGHIDKRRAENSTCMQCQRDNAKLNRLKNLEKYRERDRQNAIKFKEYRREKSSDYYYNNKEYIFAKMRSYLRLRETKMQKAFFQKEIYKNCINEIYSTVTKINKLSDTKYSVDHIVPLTGKNVCGLHVPWNLRIITIKENSEKHNKNFKYPMKVESYWDLKNNGKLAAFLESIHATISS